MFNRQECKKFLDSNPRQETIEETWTRIKAQGFIVDDEFFESAGDKAGKAELRRVMEAIDPATGLPSHVSLRGKDGVDRYVPLQLFDADAFFKARALDYGRMIYFARKVRRWEAVSGLEQLSFDLSWIDNEGAEDAA